MTHEFGIDLPSIDAPTYSKADYNDSLEDIWVTLVDNAEPKKVREHC